VNFDLSEEQKLLQHSVGQLLEQQCTPQRVREVSERAEGFDPELWKQLCEIGVTGLSVPEAHGGAGLAVLDLACVAEVLGYHAAPIPFLGHALAIRAISEGGTDAQRERWLPRLAAGETVGTIAFASSDGGWSPSDWRMPASERLRGSKSFVPCADRADLAVVGLAGGSLGLVELPGEGVDHAVVDAADLTRPVGTLEFSAAAWDALPANPETVRGVCDTGLVLLAADAFGGAQRLLEMCVQHAMTREQFGVKIGSFQALKHELADMSLKVEPNRGLYWKAAYLQDNADPEAERAAAIAKAHNTDRFMEVARSTIEVHGGIGFTWECDAQIWFKRAMFDRAFLGSPREHRRRQAELASW